MSQIERRQSRISRIRTRQHIDGQRDEQVVINPSLHHWIGKSEALPKHISSFIAEHKDDPGVKVSADNLTYIISAEHATRTSFQI